MKTIRLLALALLAQAVFSSAALRAQAQAEKAPYPAMAPLNQYLMADVIGSSGRIGRLYLPRNESVEMALKRDIGFDFLET